MLRPAVLLRDPELIKDVVTTNFNSFRNNDVNISKKYDPLSATNPFFNDDDEWREGRKTISPMFSQIKVKIFVNMMMKKKTQKSNHSILDERHNTCDERCRCKFCQIYRHISRKYGFPRKRSKKNQFKYRQNIEHFLKILDLYSIYNGKCDKILV